MCIEVAWRPSKHCTWRDPFVRTREDKVDNKVDLVVRTYVLHLSQVHTLGWVAMSKQLYEFFQTNQQWCFHFVRHHVSACSLESFQTVFL